MPTIIHKKIKPSACQATHYNGTRNKSITSSLARKGLKLAPVVVGLAGLQALPVSAATNLHFAIDANPSMTITLQDASNNDLADNASTLSIAPTSEGTFGSQDINVLVGTNNYSGYKLYIMSSSPALSNSSNVFQSGETYSIDPISNNGGNGYTLSEFQSSNDTLNKWGYSVASTNIANYTTNFFPVTTSNVEINNNNSFTETPDTTTITFATKLNDAIPSGRYDTTITFIATATPNPTCYDSGCTITYDDNGANSTTTMANQTVNKHTASATLWPSNFQRAGYGFAGWNTSPDGSGINYGPMESVDTTTIFANNITLYANWIASAGNLQDWNGCDGLPSGAVTALTDTRDNNVYAVAKLADGKCWMIENLRLDNTPELSSANTNVAPGWTGMSSNHLAAPGTDDSYWCTSSGAACVNQSRLATQNTASSIDSMTEANANIYSYGNYYNWYSATAGSGTQSVDAKNSDVANSICPSGNWRLPTGGASDRTNVATTSDFWALGLAMMGMGPNNLNSNNTYPYYDSSSSATTTTFAGKTMIGLTANKAVRTYPNNFLFSGVQNGASTNYRGTIGYYWSSTATSAQNAYYLGLSTSNVYPGTNNVVNKHAGYSVRCVIGS